MGERGALNPRHFRQKNGKKPTNPDVHIPKKRRRIGVTEISPEPQGLRGLGRVLKNGKTGPGKDAG